MPLRHRLQGLSRTGSREIAAPAPPALGRAKLTNRRIPSSASVAGELCLSYYSMGLFASTQKV
ncbi:hypothetical protein [Kamptonema formosum]|uniref:hypothetical protein n=1 Tax=Kamptonema formosum TaxID=331992 RepID=UPI0012DF86AF|nr:hypothetical protein [Oscillatoria sp. PCC 10802]